MKAIGLKIAVVTTSPSVGEPDELNRTEIRLNGELVWPRYEKRKGSGEWEVEEFRAYPIGEIEIGDWLRIEIPSGFLEGTVTELREQQGQNIFPATEIILENGRWEGRAGGLKGGLSGWGPFKLLNPHHATVIETSAFDRRITYAVYESIRGAAGLLADGDRTRQQVLMEAFLAVSFMYRDEEDEREKAVAEKALRDNPALAFDYAMGGALYIAQGACWDCCEEGRVQEGHSLCHPLEPGLRQLVAAGIANLEPEDRHNLAGRGWMIIVDLGELRRIFSRPVDWRRGHALCWPKEWRRRRSFFEERRRASTLRGESGW